jgi:cytochrome P450
MTEARKGELKSEGSDELGAFEKDAQLASHATEKKNYLQDDLTTVAQAMQFFFAGFSTTSNFLAFAFYFLALSPDVQDKLREEVNSQLFVKGDEKEIDYDKLNGLNYLDMVVQETLRKFPALARLERMCGKDYYDASEKLRIPKGAMVAIPVQAIHNDKQHYQYPDRFYPEHFSAENKAKRSPYAYLPFGQGPRNCIGMRFALIEGKAAIAHLVHRFKIVPSANSPIPVKMRGVGFGMQLPDDFQLALRLAN